MVSFFAFLKSFGPSVRKNGWPFTMLVLFGFAFYHYSERLIAFAYPLVVEFVQSTVKTQKSLTDTQEQILNTQQEQVENSRRVINLHEKIDQAMSKDSSLIQDIHRSVVAPKTAETP